MLRNCLLAVRKPFWNNCKKCILEFFISLFIFVVVIDLLSTKLSLCRPVAVMILLHDSVISNFIIYNFYITSSMFLPPALCVCRYLKVPMGNMGVLDPTEIHNRGQLKSHMKEAMIKLGYHLLCFFIYLYRWEHFNCLDNNRLSLKLFCCIVVVFCVISQPALFLQHDPGSDQRLKHTGPLSSPTHRAPSSCTLLPQTCLSNAIRSAVNLLRCVCCHRFHFLTLVKSGVFGTVHCCDSLSLVWIQTYQTLHDTLPSFAFW